MEEASREDSFAFAPRQAYAVQLRLTPELKTALQQAQQAGRAVSLRIRQDGPNQQATLTIGGQEFFLSASSESNNDIIQLPDSQQQGSECTVVGSIHQKLSLQRTLDAGLKQRLKALETEQQLKQKRRQAVLLDKQVVGGSKAVVKTVTRQAAPQAPKPPLASARPLGLLSSSQLTHPRTLGQSLGNAQPVKKSLDPPKPNSKKPASMSKPASTPPPPAHAVPPPPAHNASALVRPLVSTPPQPQAGTPVETSPSGNGSGQDYASGPGPAQGSAAAVPAAPAPAPPPPAPPPQQPQQPPEPPPRSAVLAAAQGDAQLCIVAIMLATQPTSAQKLQTSFNTAYKIAKRKAEAKEYIARLIQGCCDRVHPNKLRLKPEVQMRDGARAEALGKDSVGGAGAGPGPASTSAPMAAPASAFGAADDMPFGSGLGQGSGVASGLTASPPGQAASKKKKALGGAKAGAGAGAGGEGSKAGSKKRSRDGTAGARPAPPPLQPGQRASAGLSSQQQQQQRQTLSSQPQHRSPISYDDFSEDEEPIVINRSAKARPGVSKADAGSKADRGSTAEGGSKAERPGANKKWKVSGSAAMPEPSREQAVGGSAMVVEDTAPGRRPGSGSGVGDEPAPAAAPTPGAGGFGFAYYMAQLERLGQSGAETSGPGETGEENVVGAHDVPELSSALVVPPPAPPPLMGMPPVQAPPARQDPVEPLQLQLPSEQVPAQQQQHAQRQHLFVEEDDEEEEQLHYQRQRQRQRAGPGARGQGQARRAGPGIPWLPPPPLSSVGLEPSMALPGAALAASVGSDQGSEGSAQLGPPPLVSQGPSPQSGDEVAPLVVPPPPPALRRVPDEVSYLDGLELEEGSTQEEEQYKQLCQTWGGNTVDEPAGMRGPIQSLEQYEQYGREYREKYDLFFSVHQKCNNVLLMADAYRTEAAEALDEQTRSRCHRELWRLGAKQWPRLKRWQALKDTVQRDLESIRAAVELYIGRLRQAQQEHAAMEGDSGDDE